MKKPVEIIQGDKSLRLTLYISVASYLLFVISIEPAIDFILLSLFEQKDPYSIEHLNKLKLILSALLYSLLAFIPAIFATWFGYRVATFLVLQRTCLQNNLLCSIKPLTIIKLRTFYVRILPI